MTPKGGHSLVATSFTVDLSEVDNTTTTILSYGSEEDREIQAIVDEHIKPGKEYTLADTEGTIVGWIGQERPILNLDDDVLADEDGVYDLDGCETEEQVDALVIRAKACLRILDMATPNEDSDVSWGGNPYQNERDFLEEIVREAPAAKKERAEEFAENAEEERVRATSCNGGLDRASGTIQHNVTCPIHG
jgi:hypothetical protein